jgi:hypothetical protein
MREPHSRSQFSPEDPAGSCFPVTLPFFRVMHHHTEGVAGYGERDTLATTAPLFLLPGVQLDQRNAWCSVVSFSGHSARGIFRIRNAFSFAANQILDSIRAMVDSNNAASKLCAEVPRHATRNFLLEISAAQLGKGRCFAPPRCIPSRMPQAAAETVPVSAPSARCTGAAFPAWTVRP